MYQSITINLYKKKITIKFSGNFEKIRILNKRVFILIVQSDFLSIIWVLIIDLRTLLSIR